MSKKKRDTGKNILLGMMIFGVVLVVIGALLLNINSLSSIGIALGFFIFVLSLIIFNLQYNKTGCCSSNYMEDTSEVYSEEIDDETIEQKEEKKKTNVSIKYLYTKGRPRKNAICMITKISLDGEKDVLRCPKCKSYFLGQYLRGWLEENNNCPVCKRVLKIEI